MFVFFQKTPTCETPFNTEGVPSPTSTDRDTPDSRDAGASSSASSYSRCCSAPAGQASYNGGRFFSTPPPQYSPNNNHPTPSFIYTAHPAQYANSFQSSQPSTVIDSQTASNLHSSTTPTSNMTNNQFINNQAPTSSNGLQSSTNVDNNCSQISQPVNYSMYQPQSSFTSNTMTSDRQQNVACHPNFACNNFIQQTFTTKITATAKLTVELPQKPNRLTRPREPPIPPTRNSKSHY